LCPFCRDFLAHVSRANNTASTRADQRVGGRPTFEALWMPSFKPRETRKKLIQALEMLQTKRDKNPPKKHGNIPL